MTTDRTLTDIAARLDALRDTLLPTFAEFLNGSLSPRQFAIQSVSSAPIQPLNWYNMASRFHALVQLALTRPWQDVAPHYSAASRSLAGLGFDTDQQRRLVGMYVALAHNAARWSPEELDALEHLRQRLQDAIASS